jgi:hypothetical protein
MSTIPCFEWIVQRKAFALPYPHGADCPYCHGHGDEPEPEPEPFEPSAADRDWWSDAPPPPCGAPSWADWYSYLDWLDDENRRDFERYVETADRAPIDW